MKKKNLVNGCLEDSAKYYFILVALSEIKSTLSKSTIVFFD